MESDATEDVVYQPIESCNYCNESDRVWLIAKQKKIGYYCNKMKKFACNVKEPIPPDCPYRFNNKE